MIKKMLRINKYLVIIYFDNDNNKEVICNDGNAVNKAIKYKKKYLTLLRLNDKLNIKVG